MKLLTLNTHSLIEQNFQSNVKVLANAIVSKNIEVIALQEVMQTISENALNEDNYAKLLVNELKEKGCEYNLVWHGFKKSYNKFEEGLAIISKQKIEAKAIITLTPFDDYNNWKTRKSIGVKINNKWYFCVHMGWWDDNQAPFMNQFQKLLSELPQNEEIYLMGDFNSEAGEREKGYDYVIKNGFYDTYTLAQEKDDGTTAHSQIDGWEKEQKLRKMRIDYIFTNRKQKILSSHTIFNGINEKIISDHYGIIVTL